MFKKLFKKAQNSVKKGLLKYVLSTLLLMVLLVPSSYGQFVHTDGTKIVDENNEDIYFSGMNLGNWLLWEGYLMMGDFQYRTHSQFLESMAVAFGNDMTKAEEFQHQWRLNYVTQKAMDDLKALGYNSVRVPFHYNMFWDEATATIKDDGFQYFDRVIEYCKANNMYVMLDMHAAPGYQNPGDHCDNIESDQSHPDGTVHFWEGNNLAIASAVWKHIATKYANEPTIWGYDLINEPVPSEDDKYKLLPSLITMTNAIREVDNNHIIIAEGSWWGSDMEAIDWTNETVIEETGITSRWDNNLVYQTHHYSNDVSLLDGRLDICDKLDVPMILGEYGESDMSNLRNMTDWCINNSVDYYPWSFKKMSHDKCLWTIEPNAAYEELKAAITAGTTGPSTLYNDMIDFCQNNIANGAEGLVWDQAFYDATKMSCNVGTPSDLTSSNITGVSVKVSWSDVSGEAGYNVTCSNGQSVSLAANATSYTFSGLANDTKYTISVAAFTNDCVGGSASIDAKTLCLGGQTAYSGTALALPGILEGENYDKGCDAYYDLSDGNTGGLYRTDDVDITEGVDGGYAIGWIDAGEWVEYTVNVENTATYDLEYIAASPDGTGEIQLQVGDEILTTLVAPNTGDWDVYDTATTTIGLTQGEQIIRLVFSGSINFDKLSILTERDPSFLSKIEITPSTSTIYLDENVDLTATGYDQYDEVYTISESWSSNGVVNQNGLFSGESIGSFTITASASGVSASANVNVIAIPECTPNLPGTIEAEAYDSMSGIQTENCSEGGSDVGWIDTGDWLQFDDICVASNSTYKVEFRVASNSNGGQFELQDQDNNVLVTVDVPVTGGWQNWETVESIVSLSKSVTSLKIAITEGGFNINFFDATIYTDDDDDDEVTGVELSASSLLLEVNETSNLIKTVIPSSATNQNVTWISSDEDVATVSASGLVTAVSEGYATITVTTIDGGFEAYCDVTVTEVVDDLTSILIQAEDYIESAGIQTENTSDIDGGLNVGWTDGGDWMAYAVDIPASGTYTIEYRVASENGDGELQLEQLGGGYSYGALSVPSTGGWQEWTTISHTVSLDAGEQNIAIAVNNGGWNLNWIKISSSSTKSAQINPNLTNHIALNIYPNPTSDIVNIAGLKEDANIEVYNTAGVMVLETYGNSINVSNLNSGVYFLQVVQSNSSAQFRFMKE